jgi:hypothetical protein
LIKGLDPHYEPFPIINVQGPTTVNLPFGWTWCKGPAPELPPFCPADGKFADWLYPAHMFGGSCFLPFVPLYGQGGQALPFAEYSPPDLAAEAAANFDLYYTRDYVDCIGTTSHFVVLGVATRFPNAFDGSYPQIVPQIDVIPAVDVPCLSVQ